MLNVNQSKVSPFLDKKKIIFEEKLVSLLFGIYNETLDIFLCQILSYGINKLFINLRSRCCICLVF